MISIAECLHAARDLEQVSDSARLDVELLLAEALQKPRSYLYTWPDQAVEHEAYLRFSALLERRKQGEPIAYLLGEKEFWSLSLRVNDSTLIPRPETELLVETALGLLSAGEAAEVLDLGTGTGAVALALASERPHWKMLAVDNSPAAVKLAIENCRGHGFTNVAISRSNWFDNVNGAFDLIVANPPYIDAEDSHLQQGDVRFEPHSALVADDHGLADIRLIAAHARDHLRPQAWLAMEHGYDQGDRVRALLTELGYTNIKTRQDIGGKDRLTLARHTDNGVADERR